MTHFDRLLPTVLLTLLIAAAAPRAADACDICLIGTFSYHNVGESEVVLQATRVTNYRLGGHSGTLYLETWATTYPYSGGDIVGYRVASARLGELYGGLSFYNVSSGVIARRDPPPGTYFLSMLLVEYGNGIVSHGPFYNLYVVDPPSTTTTTIGTTTTTTSVAVTTTTMPPGSTTPKAPIAKPACPFACGAEIAACRSTCPARPVGQRRRCRRACKRAVVQTCRQTGTCETAPSASLAEERSFEESGAGMPSTNGPLAVDPSVARQ